MSGKGGVGKSLVTSLLATSMRKKVIPVQYLIMISQIPIDSNLAAACDAGHIEEYDADGLTELTQTSILPAANQDLI